MLRRRTISWVIRSPSCSALRMSRAIPVSSARSRTSSRAAARPEDVGPRLREQLEVDRIPACYRAEGHRGQASRAPAGRDGLTERRQPRTTAASSARSSMAFHQLALEASRLVAVGGPARPDPVAAELPRVGVVGERPVEHVGELVAVGRVLDRGDQLDPVVEVAGHQVGGADVDAGLVRPLEREDPRVLEEAADDRDDPDVLRDPGTPGRSAQIPRTLRSTSTPACEAR